MYDKLERHENKKIRFLITRTFKNFVSKISFSKPQFNSQSIENTKFNVNIN